MIYEDFIKGVQGEQRAYIAEELDRMQRAYALWLEYQEAMAELGLHALSSIEINDRQRELQQMLTAVEETHGDSPTMRFAFERFQADNRSDH